jgi:hypothetical protein
MNLDEERKDKFIVFTSERERERKKEEGETLLCIPGKICLSVVVLMSDVH